MQALVGKDMQPRDGWQGGKIELAPETGMDGGVGLYRISRPDKRSLERGAKRIADRALSGAQASHSSAKDNGCHG